MFGSLIKESKYLPKFGSEDFAFYTQKLPGSFYRLGVGSVEKDEIMNLHSSSFNADERSLEIGMGLMAFLALEELKNKP